MSCSDLIYIVIANYNCTTSAWSANPYASYAVGYEADGFAISDWEYSSDGLIATRYVCGEAFEWVEIDYNYYLILREGLELPTLIPLCCGVSIFEMEANYDCDANTWDIIPLSSSCSSSDVYSPTPWTYSNYGLTAHRTIAGSQCVDISAACAVNSIPIVDELPKTPPCNCIYNNQCCYDLLIYNVVANYNCVTRSWLFYANSATVVGYQDDGFAISDWEYSSDGLIATRNVCGEPFEGVYFEVDALYGIPREGLIPTLTPFCCGVSIFEMEANYDCDANTWDIIPLSSSCSSSNVYSPTPWTYSNYGLTAHRTIAGSQCVNISAACAVNSIPIVALDQLPTTPPCTCISDNQCRFCQECNSVVGGCEKITGIDRLGNDCCNGIRLPNNSYTCCSQNDFSYGAIIVRDGFGYNCCYDTYCSDDDECCQSNALNPTSSCISMSAGGCSSRRSSYEAIDDAWCILNKQRYFNPISLSNMLSVISISGVSNDGRYGYMSNNPYIIDPLSINNIQDYPSFYNYSLSGSSGIGDLNAIYSGYTSNNLYIIDPLSINNIQDYPSFDNYSLSGVSWEPTDNWILPEAPTNFNVDMGLTQLTISWDAMPEALSYKVYRDGLFVQDVYSSNYSDRGLTDGTAYEYNISSVGFGGESSLSTSISGVFEKTITDYAIVDISSGKNSTYYPVTFTNDVPTDSERANLDKIILRWIPPGSFIMGSRLVTLTKGFYMGIFTMSVSQYSNIKDDINHQHRFLSGPQMAVGWDDMRGGEWNGPSGGSPSPTSAVGKLSSNTMLKFDLPTESQWEYACRAGTTTAFNWGYNASTSFPCDRDPNLFWRVNYAQHQGRLNPFPPPYPLCNDGDIWTAVNNGPVAVNDSRYIPNAWDLLHMHGNVKEACLDYFENDNTSESIDPVGPATGTSRVSRGGSWYDWLWLTGSAHRETYNSDIFSGFRVIIQDV
jgi:formylglycine-generating enzyme required for sulfatase activity